ncbi:MAG: hypothetical protein H0T86_08765 [Gemmatimonadales bacterium]|nr:hypothetical protein [Gemmatimonadales bacterium]
MTPYRSLLRLATVTSLAAGAAAGTACGSDESQAGDEHVPVSYTVLVDDVPASAPFVLTQGETVRVRLEFVTAGGEDLDDAEADHYAGLTFTPTSLASATRVADRNYQFDVTGGTAGTGTLVVSYGHDIEADETTFDAAAVTVQGAQ